MIGQSRQTGDAAAVRIVRGAWGMILTSVEYRPDSNFRQIADADNETDVRT